MKRIMWIIAVLMIGFVCVAGAQTQKIGVTAGVNIANLNGISNATTRNGMIVGAFVEDDFIGGFAVQPELLFSVKGAKTSTSSPLVTQSTWTANYVEVPILLKYNFLSLPVVPLGVDLYAGPDFTFNVASKNETTYAGVVTTTDEKGDTHPFDFNIAVGGGPNLDLGPMELGVELRYTFGTGPAFKNGGSGNPFGDAKNGVWSIMASAAF